MLEEILYKVPNVLNWRHSWWTRLPEEARNNAIGGLVVSGIVGLLTILGFVLKRLFRPVPLPSVPLPPAPQPQIIARPSAPPTSPPSLMIPRPPATGYVRRRDADGRDIVNSLTRADLSPFVM